MALTLRPNILKSGFLLIGIFSNQAMATDCFAWSNFSSTNPLLAPQSVEVGNLQNYINGLESSEGVIFDVEKRERELWLDIVYVPNEAAVITGLRAVMQIGRLASDEFDRVILSDSGKGIYQIQEPRLREIGCQFIWGEEGGQNPIYLMRLFFENVELYPSGYKAVVGFSGHLFGDTTLAMEYHNSQFVSSWMLSALQD